MSAFPFQRLLALFEVVKRLWFQAGKQSRRIGKGQSKPRRHSAFFELP